MPVEHLHGVVLSPLEGDPCAHYQDAGGELDGEPYWALIDAVGYLPDPEKVAAPWRGAGRPDLSSTLARRRLEAHVSRILG